MSDKCNSSEFSTGVSNTIPLMYDWIVKYNSSEFRKGIPKTIPPSLGQEFRIQFLRVFRKRVPNTIPSRLGHECQIQFLPPSL
jgi:hypothetical protein